MIRSGVGLVTLIFIVMQIEQIVFMDIVQLVDVDKIYQ